MAKKQSKAREKQRQQQQARKAAKKKRLQQSGRTSGYTTPEARSIDETAVPGFGPEEYGMMLINSEYLANEPEFEDIFIEPAECMGALVFAADSTGVRPDQFGHLQQEEQEDFLINVMDEAVRYILSDKALRQQILKQVDALQQRFKNQEEISLIYLQASAIYTFLESDRKGKAWAAVGLVRELVMNSLKLGIKLFNIVDGEPEQLLSDTEAQQKIQSLYEKAPNLRRFLDKKIDDIWEKSMDETFTGELELNLFTLDEIKAAVEIFRRYFPTEEPDEEESEDDKDRPRQYVSAVTDYIRGLLTPERLEQMSRHLDDLKSKTSAEHQIFVSMLGDDVKEEPDDLVPTLLKIFMGETLAVLRQVETDSEESE